MRIHADFHSFCIIQSGALSSLCGVSFLFLPSPRFMLASVFIVYAAVFSLSLSRVLNCCLCAFSTLFAFHCLRAISLRAMSSLFALHCLRAMPSVCAVLSFRAMSSICAFSSLSLFLFLCLWGLRCFKAARVYVLLGCRGWAD